MNIMVKTNTQNAFRRLLVLPWIIVFERKKKLITELHLCRICERCSEDMSTKDALSFALSFVKKNSAHEAKDRVEMWCISGWYAFHLKTCSKLKITRPKKFYLFHTHTHTHCVATKQFLPFQKHWPYSPDRSESDNKKLHHHWTCFVV